MLALSYALDPPQMLRSLEASRDTLGLARRKLIDVVHQVTALTGGAPYAVIGGLAQILWARKTHTDDLDVLLLVTQLLRPGAMAAIAATELLLARRAKGPFDASYAERWAVRVGRVDALHRTFTRADEIERNT